MIPYSPPGLHLVESATVRDLMARYEVDEADARAILDRLRATAARESGSRMLMSSRPCDYRGSEDD